MNQQHTAVIHECAALSIAGKISFGAIVGKLSGSTPDRATVAARVKAELTNG